MTIFGRGYFFRGETEWSGVSLFRLLAALVVESPAPEDNLDELVEVFHSAVVSAGVMTMTTCLDSGRTRE